MFNVGGGEVLVILIVALIVLGPTKLPDAARQVGRAMSELRRLSSGFKSELESAMDESAEDQARQRGDALRAAPTEAKPIDPGPVRTSPLSPPAGGSPSEGSTGNGTSGTEGGNGATPPTGADDDPRT